jgi:type II secretory pathway component GspD/PulD (secretin)
VVPTVVSASIDTTQGSPVIDFVHLDVQVEKSTPGIFNGGVSIARNAANTNVLLLDGEQTVIGGLYSVERNKTRRGIVFLKDLPLLGRLFGSDQTVDTQRELLVVLQAEVVRSVPERFQSPERPRDMLEQRREELRRLLERTSPQLRRETPPSSR